MLNALQCRVLSNKTQYSVCLLHKFHRFQWVGMNLCMRTKLSTCPTVRHAGATGGPCGAHVSRTDVQLEPGEWMQNKRTWSVVPTLVSWVKKRFTCAPGHQHAFASDMATRIKPKRRDYFYRILSGITILHLDQSNIFIHSFHDTNR